MDSDSNWPKDSETGEELALLASLPGSFWQDAGAKLPNGYCLSIFLKHASGDRKTLRRMAVHEQSQQSKLSAAPIKVLIHHMAQPAISSTHTMPVTPMLEIKLKAPAEEDRDPAMPDRGTTVSKLGGVPGWAQDEINIPGHKYVLQFEELELAKACPAWAGVFGGGNGFLFIKELKGNIESGIFFVQFT